MIGHNRRKLQAMTRLYFSRHLKGAVGTSPMLDRSMRWLEAVLLESIVGIASRLPLETASAVGGRIGAELGSRTRKHRHVIDNLRIVFPDADRAWIERTALGVWEQIGRVAGEYPHLPSFLDSDRVELVVEFDLERLRRSPRGYVFVAMHQANWNLLSLGGHLGGFPISAVNRRQINPRGEALVAR